MNNGSNKTGIMLDLETLGNKPGSVIVAIGAVKFRDGNIIGSEFYLRINPQSCVDVGLTMDASTVLWWLKQSDEARNEICKPGCHLSEALAHFGVWIGADWGSVEMWGNGAAFDNVLLGDAYDRVQQPRPWKFWNDRCYRTVKNLFPEVEIERCGTHHNALDDAISQAKHLMRIQAMLPSLCNVSR